MSNITKEILAILVGVVGGGLIAMFGFPPVLYYWTKWMTYFFT